jgi:hypothetical protein
LRTDDEAIRAQSTIMGQTVFGISKLVASSTLIRFTPKPRSICTDGPHPYKLNVVGARSAQGFAKASGGA